jgi:hypothetical protein
MNGGGAPKPETRQKESCGNGGAVESVESQKQASPSFHSPLEISPKAGEISTFPQLRRKQAVEKWKTKSRFPTFPPPRIPFFQEPKNRTSGGLRPPPGDGRFAPR